jgi:valyl-tRNA synthetase
VIYEQKVDVAAERERLTRELKKLETEFANNQRQLGNENFLKKAPTHVVQGLRRREGELKLLLENTKAALQELEGK